MFREGQVHKTYWAVVSAPDGEVGHRGRGAGGSQEAVLDGEWHELEHWLVRNERQNKSYAYDREVPHSKRAVLRYRVIGRSERYVLVEVRLLTGRHHQIRCQLAAMGCPIRGDLKYGARRSNADGSISLLARRVEFVHPVSKQPVSVEAPLPDDPLWQVFSMEDGRGKMEEGRWKKEDVRCKR